MKASIEEISEDLRRLLADAEALFEATSDDTDVELDEAGKAARATLHRICGHLRNARNEVANRARKLDGAVHENPWRVLLATAVVAFVAGLALRRR